MIRICNYNESGAPELFARSAERACVESAVREIIDGVRRGGDAALYRYAREFDKAELDALEVTEAELDAALKAAGPRFLEVLKRAAENIEAFHRRQIRSGFTMTGEDGVVLGQRILPLDKVGVYIPGGTASYPSSALMNLIPAKLAGVRELVMATPPRPDGTIDPNILAAAKLGGADRIFKIGGAQAVAALAYGTETIPRVDKIAGPGNAYVAEAKKQVFGIVGIDMLAGPSEILVIADESCRADYVAADLLSQAEHDANASAVLITDSAAFAEAVSAELEKQLPALPRYDIARASIDNNGRLVIVDSLETAVALANEYAPEHLELCVDNPFDYLDQVRSAGSVFLGKYCPEALGDYFAGPNHTLPTVGTARFSSPLSVDDFVRKSSFTYYTKKALAGVAEDIALFAGAEGLHAHARSVTCRFEEDSKP